VRDSAGLLDAHIASYCEKSANSKSWNLLQIHVGTTVAVCDTWSRLRIGVASRYR
jgi:hypothetical protein